jgi:hypothetical protein
MVQAYPAESDQLISRLAMSAIEQIDAGRVGGSCSVVLSLTEENEVQVWDLETLEPLHTLRQLAGLWELGVGGNWSGRGGVRAAGVNFGRGGAWCHGAAGQGDGLPAGAAPSHRETMPRRAEARSPNCPILCPAPAQPRWPATA